METQLMIPKELGFIIDNVLFFQILNEIEQESKMIMLSVKL